MRPSEVESLLEQHGFPLYIYDGEAISGQISLLKQIFQGFEILYSMKANSNADLCRFIITQDLGIDAASKMKCWRRVPWAFPKKEFCFQRPARQSRICGKASANA